MKIIISPAKKMNVDADSLEVKSFPYFLPQAEILKEALQKLNAKELKILWQCNDIIANKNINRLKSMDLHKNLTPAILAYEGIQYQYMAPGVFTNEEFDYIADNLNILSGFYGILRPFDGVVPYRLEMQAKLSVDGHKNLYDFWGEKLAKKLVIDTDLILNLASKEYSKAVHKFLPENIKFVTCTFGENINGKIVEKGTLCKMARGQMVRFLAQNNVTIIDEIKNFNSFGYEFNENYSTNQNLTFIKK